MKKLFLMIYKWIYMTKFYYLYTYVSVSIGYLVAPELVLYLWAVGLIIIFVQYFIIFSKWRNINNVIEDMHLRQLKLISIGPLVFIGLLLRICTGHLINISTTIFPSSGTSFESTVNFMSSPINLLLFVFLAVILGPIIEEWIFRNLLFRSFLGIEFSIMLAIIAQAFFFGLIHWNLVQFISAFFSGIVFMLVVLKYRSISSSIIVHSVSNAITVVTVLYYSKYKILQVIFGNKYIGIAACLILTIILLQNKFNTRDMKKKITHA